MRTIREFTIDLVKKPPIAFPLIGLFHLLWLFWTIYDDRSVPFPDVVWLEALWMLAYTTCWIAACDNKKWGANGYIILTLLNAALFVAARYHKVPPVYVSNMFAVDVLFSMLLLYYYKNFN